MPDCSVEMGASSASELEKIVSLERSKVQEIIDILDAQEPSLEFGDISDSISEIVGDELAPILTLHVTSIAMFSDRPDRNIEEVILALREGLKSFGWSDEQLEKYDAFSDSFDSLASNRAFYVGAKAASLFRQSGNHLHEVKSIVDARPIFDPDRKKIDMIILFTNLCLTISDATETESQVNLALDHEELTRIRDECDKALEKLSILGTTLESGAVDRVTIYGRRVD